jgi:hypothetical protein
MALGIAAPDGVVHAQPKDRALCRAACEARNVPRSCVWLARRPKRCREHAIKACRRNVRRGQPVACTPPPELPGCLTHHSCPFGALCVDAVCQVVPCTDCTGMNVCQGDKCVVGNCAASTENCPAGHHCQPVDGPFGSISGTCQPDDPGIRYCTTNTDCITAGEFNLVCKRGECVRRGRPGNRRPTTSTTSSTSTTMGGPTTTTTMPAACFDVFDCPGTSACCSQQCVPDPYAGMGVCSTIYTPACTLCENDDDCDCNGIFCDSCEGTASLSGCVDPCAP